MGLAPLAQRRAAAVAWRDKGASLQDMLDFARLRSIDERIQQVFSF